MFDVVFSPDGTVLASAEGPWARQDANGPNSGDQPGAVTIWDPASGRSLYSLKKFNFYVWGLAFSPDGKILATAGGRTRIDSYPRKEGEGEIKLWEVSTGREMAVLPAKQSRLLCIAFTRDGARLVTGEQERGYRILEVPDSPVARVRLWDLLTHQEVYSLPGLRDAIYDLAVAGDNKSLASALADGTVKIWRMDAIEKGK